MRFTTILILLFFSNSIYTQNYIPIDTAHWDIKAKAYVIEKYKGKKAIYIQAGGMTLKNQTFLNGTIEFDIFLKEEQAFPGITFRTTKNFDGEKWYIRPHLSGKPDGNQAVPLTNGVTPWQLYFGEKYSFPYRYKFNDWTHVKLVVNNDKAQVFLDGTEKPNLSWHLFHKAQSGSISFNGGRLSGMHLANIKINTSTTRIAGFKPKERKALKNLIPTWKISDKFEEKLLDSPNTYKKLISSRKWTNSISVEEGTAANISRKAQLFNNKSKNTVFAKIEIYSDKNQTKLFEFGYSDRVTTILNGIPIYRGTNKWRSRDYRYLGTIGLFDAVYLPLKKGKNILLMAVSEDFGGWLITGRFKDNSQIKIIY
ncbi:conserved protein of unknown function [Tenacibaculum sp. 190524A02b]|uniref:hypothetical protein n=1 Tax=Tenacibaculum vairaonense TaxID=3137860 RepID=UPI0032B2BE00